MNGARILVVDDEIKMQRILDIALRKAGYEVRTAGNGREALDILDTEAFELIISDLRMPGMGGLEFLRALRERGDDCPVIVVTAYGTVESAVEAMKHGAADYLIRPFEIEAIEVAITRALKLGHVQRENRFLRNEVERGWGDFVGTSPAMQQVYSLIRQVGPSRSAVLIAGETGTGKELAAHAVHKASGRSGLFVPINCAAIPADILESELFGYVRGAFTGASRDRVGKFELASNGTLFLDEITEMSPALQAKLLRILQDGHVERLGSNQRIPVDVRIVAATNRDALVAVREQRLREDLYYRLNVLTIALPTLRDRPEDIIGLAEHFIDVHSQRLGRAQPVLEPSAQAALLAHRWPGNVRELQNVIERALVLNRGDSISAEQLALFEPPGTADAVTATPENADFALQPQVEAFEWGLIERAVAATGGNKSAAARLLQISERSLWYKLKKRGVSDD